MNRRTRSLWLALALMLSSLAGLTVLAQTPAAGGTPAPAGTPKKEMTLLAMWIQGGWCMYPILALSAVAMGLGIYAGIYTRDVKMVQSGLVPSIQDAIAKLDIASASQICSGSPGTMTTILNAGLSRLTEDHMDIANVEKAMEEAATEETTAGMKPINLVSIMASIAPMFGLLGTVDGMIKAFQKIGLGGMGDPEKLADDIGQAMITTWFGLVVGIPAMVIYFVLKSGYQAKIAKIGRILGNLTHQLTLALKRGGVVEQSPAADESAAQA